jgi:hypothetical protein
MTQVYRTLRVPPGGEGVLGVVVDAAPMNLIGPELVRDLARVMVLESADPEYFIPHVDLTKGRRVRRRGGPPAAADPVRRRGERHLRGARPARLSIHNP